jgi:hypothetical protein
VPKNRNKDTRDTINLIRPGDYFVTTGIKDGFLHIPVAVNSRDFLGFRFAQTYYRWKVLPFGLCASPYYFNKVIRPIIVYLRSIGLRVNAFINDFLLASSRSTATEHVDQLLQTLSWVLLLILKIHNLIHQYLLNILGIQFTAL